MGHLEGVAPVCLGHVANAAALIGNVKRSLSLIEVFARKLQFSMAERGLIGVQFTRYVKGRPQSDTLNVALAVEYMR